MVPEYNVCLEYDVTTGKSGGHEVRSLAESLWTGSDACYAGTI